jgi:hypothetical protein
MSIIRILFLVLLFFLVGVNVLQADGLVPCTGDNCDFVQLKQLIENVMNFLIFNIGVPAAAVAIMIGGWLIVTAGGNESRISHGKKIVGVAVLGLVIVLGAWLIVKTIIEYLGPGPEGGVTVPAAPKN